MDYCWNSDVLVGYSNFRSKFVEIYFNATFAEVGAGLSVSQRCISRCLLKCIFISITGIFVSVWRGIYLFFLCPSYFLVQCFGILYTYVSLCAMLLSAKDQITSLIGLILNLSFVSLAMFYIT